MNNKCECCVKGVCSCTPEKCNCGCSEGTCQCGDSCVCKDNCIKCCG